MFKTLRKRRGQSTLEYMILVAMVVAVLVVFLRPNGIFSNAYSNTLQQGTDGMETMANRIFLSHNMH